MSIVFGVTMRSVVEGIVVDHQLKCDKCKSGKVVLILESGYLSVKCLECLEDVVYPGYYTSFQHRERLSELVSRAQKRRIQVEEADHNGNGDSKTRVAKPKVRKPRLCRKCGENEVEGKKWYCDDCRKALFPEKEVRYCPDCQTEKINQNQKKCFRCKRAERVASIRYCPRCSAGRLFGKQKICTTCKIQQKKPVEPHLCVRCGETELTGKRLVCDACKAKPKTHFCKRCQKVELTGRKKLCDGCKASSGVEPRAQRPKTHQKRGKKVRICPRCKVTELERYEHFCKYCKRA